MSTRKRDDTQRRNDELERRIREREARPVTYQPIFLPYPVPPPAQPSPWTQPWITCGPAHVAPLTS